MLFYRGIEILIDAPMDLIDDLTHALQNLSSLSPQRKKWLIILSAWLIGSILLLVILSSFSLPQSSEVAKDGPTPTFSEEQKSLLTPFPTDDIYANNPTVPPPTNTPTPIPLPGTFYTANGRQNDLIINFYIEEEGDSIEQIRIRNNKTTEEKIMGYVYYYAPGDSAFFSTDYSQVIFAGGTKTNFNAISFYSIPQNKIFKVITLDQMKKTLKLKTEDTAVISSLVPAPSKMKAAFSYGKTFRSDVAANIDPNTSIIVLRLTDYKMQLLPVKGRVKAWKDENTIEYEVENPETGVFETREIPVAGF